MVGELPGGEAGEPVAGEHDPDQPGGQGLDVLDDGEAGCAGGSH